MRIEDVVNIRWKGKSVSGLVVIIGAFIYFFSDKFLGVLLILLGLFFAFAMSPTGKKYLMG